MSVDFSNRRFLKCEEPTRTKQSFKDECDINKIMKKYGKRVGVDYLFQFNAFQGGQFGDFSKVTDYQSALNQVVAANEKFLSLPAVLRKRFANDPAQFLDFVGDPKNVDEMISLGLLKKVDKTVTPVVDEKKVST